MKQFPLLFIFLSSLVVQAQLPDLIPYRKGKLWGYCDSNKKIVIEPKYDRTYPFDGTPKTALVIQNGTTGYLDSNLVFHKASYCRSINLPMVRSDKCEGKWGLLEGNNKIILPYEYDEILFHTNGWFTVQIGKKWGMVDSANNIKIPIKYDFLSYYSYGLCVFTIGNKNGYIDTEGNEIIPAKYSFGGDFSIDFAYVKCENGADGYIDRKGAEYWED